MRVVALAVVTATALLLLWLFLGQGGGGGEQRLCDVTPYRAQLYVGEGGCAVGVLEAIVVPGCEGRVTVDYVELYGIGRAKPLEPSIPVKSGDRLLIVVYASVGGQLVATMKVDESPESMARRYIDLGLCIRGLVVGTDYPGAVSWNGKVTMFTWRTVSLVD